MRLNPSNGNDERRRLGAPIGAMKTSQTNTDPTKFTTQKPLRRFWFRLNIREGVGLAPTNPKALVGLSFSEKLNLQIERGRRGRAIERKREQTEINSGATHLMEILKIAVRL